MKFPTFPLSIFISRYLVEPQSESFGPRYSDWNAASNCFAKYPDTLVPHLFVFV